MSPRAPRYLSDIGRKTRHRLEANSPLIHFKDAGHLVGQPACRPLDIRLGDFGNHICAPLDGVLDSNLGTRCRLSDK
jgi:hypothetical protein